jgi:hypothetical protein
MEDKMKKNRNLPMLTSLVCILLFSTACGTLEVGIERTATSGDAAAARVSSQATKEATLETRVATPGTSTRTATSQRPTPTSVLDGSYLSFTDPALGLSLDIPLWWEMRTTPGEIIQFFQQDHTGTLQSILTISALNPESNTLKSALEEIEQGDWGPYIRDVQPVTLGAFEAMHLVLSPGANRPPVAWLVVAPSGRAVSIIPKGNPDWIEPMITVVLDTLRPSNSDTTFIINQVQRT